MKWIKASERLPVKTTDDLEKDRPIIFANIKRSVLLYVFQSITPNIPVLLQNNLTNYEWLDESEDESTSAPVEGITDEGKGVKDFIHMGIEFSKREQFKQSPKSYRGGVGFGYSCGYQDAMRELSATPMPADNTADEKDKEIERLRDIPMMLAGGNTPEEKLLWATKEIERLNEMLSNIEGHFDINRYYFLNSNKIGNNSN